MNKDFEQRVLELNEAIKNSKKIVFFSGAGVSTESGIPDFKSKDGLYNQHDIRFDAYTPEYLLSKDCLVKDPEVFFEFYRQKLDCRGVQPNIAHYKMAELESTGKKVSVVTQNIDCLHQKAGSNNIREIHGSTGLNYCCNCKEEYGADFIFESDGGVPKCPKCGGVVRPNVTLYGESLPEKAWVDACTDIINADLVIVCGTSLTVYPAAGILGYVNPARLVIINRDRTQYDSRAWLVFHENLGDVFSRVEF